MSLLGDQARAAIAEMEAELTATQEELAITQAELDACKNPSPFELLFEEDWSEGIDPTRWFITDGPKFRKNHVVVIDGQLHLIVAPDADGTWRGGLVGCREAQTYGKYEVDCYLEPGAFRGVALLWPKSEKWPQDGEVDFFEIGAGDPNRLKNTQTFHYGSNPNHPMIHTSYVAPGSGTFAELHSVGVEWTPGELLYSLDGVEAARVTDDAVPSWPMKVHVQSRPGGVSPTEGAFVVERIRVYSWSGA